MRMSPIVRVEWTAEESNLDIVVANHVPCHWTSSPLVIPGRIELPISWLSSRRLCHWTTGLV